MATYSLLSIPTEIVIRILKNCDSLSQLSSFIAASKLIHLIWLAHKETIVWHVGKTSIPAFEYALLAVGERVLFSTFNLMFGPQEVTFIIF